MSASDSIASTVWLPVPRFEPYEASSSGFVRTFINIGQMRYPKTMNYRMSASGYRRVTLTINGKAKDMMISRMVLLAFHGLPPQANMEANHKDGNKQNDHIDNLEWVTHSNNMIHAYASGLFKGDARRRTLMPSAVLQIRALQGSRSASSVSREFGVSYSAITGIWKRKTWAFLP